MVHEGEMNYKMDILKANLSYAVSRKVGREPGEPLWGGNFIVMVPPLRMFSP